MKYILILSSVLIFARCESSSYKRPAGGTADEILVVADSVVWAGEVGDELKDVLSAPMQGLPQAEPLLIYFTLIQTRQTW